MKFSVVRLSLMLVLAFATQSTLASTVRKPTIDNPCQRDPTAVQGTFQPMNQQLNQMIASANAAQTECAAVMDMLATQNLLTASQIQQLNGPLANVPGLSLGTETETISQESMTEVLKSQYREISIYIVYVKMAITQQIADDLGRMVQELKEVEAGLFILLCKVDTALISQGSSVVNFVDSSVIPPEVMNMPDNINRYSRNYLIMKNAKTFLDNLKLHLAELIGVL